MQRLQFTTRVFARRERCRCPELQLYAVAAAVGFGAIAFAEMVAGPLIAHPDQARTTNDAAVRVDVLTNDEHLEGKPFTLDRIDPGPPRAEIDGNGVIYDPAGAFDYLTKGEIATERLTYFVKDDHGAKARAPITITIEGRNAAPKARDDKKIISENERAVVDVVANDEDPEGGKLKLLKLDKQWHRRLRGSADIDAGHIVYDPGEAFNYLAEGMNEEEILTYFIEDDADGFAHAHLTITIQGVNDRPVARDDAATTDKNKSIIVDVLANDEDPEGGKLELLDLDNRWRRRLRGSAKIENGRIVYDPGGAFNYLVEGMNEEEILTYSIEDDASGEAHAKLTITIQGVNDGPVARDDEATTDEGQNVIVDVLANDVDPVGRGLRLVALDDQWLRGSAKIEDGRIVYDPGGAFNYLVEAKDILTSLKDGPGCPILSHDELPSSDASKPRLSTAPSRDGVKTLQRALSDLTFDPGAIDGLIGPDTRHAIAAWQKTQKLNPTGDITIDQYQCLFDQRRHLIESTTANEILIYFVEDEHEAKDSAQLTIAIEGRNNYPRIRTDPPNYLHPNCGLAPADQKHGVPYCARENDDREGPPST
ncbi:MAG: Ig-like domain-containing protein, partial [Alphaproteobacteria bacterium]|nr:Ig-like domain-containing protein [Alphaproteobacteria bacterium]